MSKLGTFLTAKRKENKWSRQQVVDQMPEQVRINVSTYANIERGNIAKPPTKRLHAFSSIFKISMKTLQQLMITTSVVVLTSFSLPNKKREVDAIKVIRQYEPKEGYHVAFSGGKDSIVVYDLVKRSQVKYQAYFAFTTIDPPELVRFIRKEYSEVRFLKPEYSMYKLIAEKKRILPTRVSRYCCAFLKEYAGKGEFVIQGIRAEESNNRKNREVFEVDDRAEMLGKMYLNPILDWYEWEIWEYIANRKLVYPKMYDEGYRRIGCVGCPMITPKQRVKEFEKFPKHKNMYLKAIRKAREDKTKSIYQNFIDEYDVFAWWLSDKSVKEWKIMRDKQYKLF